MNNTTGADATDMDTLLQWADEYGVDPDSLDIRTVNEVNGQALREIAADAMPSDVSIIRDFAEAYDVDPNTVVIGESYGLSITLAQVDNIINTAKGSRLDPSSYLSPEYINIHLAQFEDGLSVIQTNWAYNRYSVTNGFVGVPDDNSLFVMPKSFCDEVIRRAGGDISIIERELGFPEGYFSDGGGLVRIDVTDVTGLNLRLPSGNETGANSLWLPGGYTSGGVPEAVTNTIPLSDILLCYILIHVFFKRR